ncbi:hypothetical protein GH714_036247 [Hevea brasiliensis]|uniref:Protein YIP n=1 Tax=Hevea brasiliensis TaxID=3981 RepID=A0A6A6L3Y8_HEVBR|nr:hypothetical protein GH714_036247 [Hevea brasiliensis]
MEESYSNLPTSHLLGSVPAVVSEEKSTTTYVAPEANMQTFPPNNNGGGSSRGYQTLGSPPEGFEQQPPNNWKGVFSVSSYTQYFVDTDIVINRMMSSFYPIGGDFSSKIDANPDLESFCTFDVKLYELFLRGRGEEYVYTRGIGFAASLGNCATYLIQKRADSSASWSFDVGYVNVAACAIYGYAIVVPLAFYFLLRYLGTNASLFLLVIPVEVLRWIIILAAGIDSACFVAVNLKSVLRGMILQLWCSPHSFCS